MICEKKDFDKKFFDFIKYDITSACLELFYIYSFGDYRIVL